MTPFRELKEIFWVNVRQLQENSSGGYGYIKKLDDGRYRIQCKGQHMEVKNRNGRRYPTSTWARHLMPGTLFTERIRNRRCVGQVEHPQTGRSSMDKGAIGITAVDLDPDTGIIWITFETMSTPHGKIVTAYCDDGFGFGVSSRGAGSTINNGDADIVQEDFEPVTWDTVLDESTIGAEVPAGMVEARQRLSDWAAQEILKDRKAILAESRGSEAAASLLARTRTEQLILVECDGDVCTLRSGCACGGTCGGCVGVLTEGEGSGAPKGYNEVLLTTSDGAGHYRAYQNGAQWDVWLMAHNLRPEMVAEGLRTMLEAKTAAESHLQTALPGRGATDPVQEGFKVKDSYSVSGSSVYLHQFDSDDEARKAARYLEKAGFLGVEMKDDGEVVVHTGYDCPSQAEAHVRRVLDHRGIELKECVSKLRPAQPGVQDISEEFRQAKDADDDIDVPTYAWVGGSMVTPAKNKGKNENYEGMPPMGPMEMMAMMAGYMAEVGRASMAEEGGDGAQGYPNDYGPGVTAIFPRGATYPHTPGAPAASGGYPSQQGHKATPWAYEISQDQPQQHSPGMVGYSGGGGHATPGATSQEGSYTAGGGRSRGSARRDPVHGVGDYETYTGWSGDRGHQPDVGPTSGQQAGPNTHPLQMTQPGFKRAYEMGQGMAGMLRANYGAAPPMNPSMDDLAMMFGWGFEGAGAVRSQGSPPGGPEDISGPADDLGKDESGYLGYEPTLDDPEDIDLDVDVNDPVLDIDRADSGPSPYDVDSTDTIHGYAEGVDEAVAKGWGGTAKAMKGDPGIDNPFALSNWMAGKGYTSHRGPRGGKKKDESTMRPAANVTPFGTAPSYAFKLENRTTGSFVKFYFNETHQMVEVREWDKAGKMLQRHGYCAAPGIKVESANKVDPATIPASVNETVKRAVSALGNGTAMMRVFAEQAGTSMPTKAATVPNYDATPGVDPAYNLDPDTQRGGSADAAKKDAGSGAPGGSATASTKQSGAAAKQVSEKDKKDDDKDEKDEAVKKDDEKDDEKDESRLDPRPTKELQDALAENEKLKAANSQLTELVESMAKLQTQERVQHRLDTILRESPELTRLKKKLGVCESVEALDKEAEEFLGVIHEAQGFKPNAAKTEPPAPAPARMSGGRDTTGKVSASSKNTLGAPTVGALAEGVGSLPALGGNGSQRKRDTKSSRVKDYRERRRGE